MHFFYLYNPELLSKAALDIVYNENNQIYVSIVSLWEMAIKSSIGKLEIKNSMEEIRAENLAIVTRDSIIPKYNVNTIW